MKNFAFTYLTFIFDQIYKSLVKKFQIDEFLFFYEGIFQNIVSKTNTSNKSPSGARAKILRNIKNEQFRKRLLAHLRVEIKFFSKLIFENFLRGGCSMSLMVVVYYVRIASTFMSWHSQQIYWKLGKNLPKIWKNRYNSVKIWIKIDRNV